MDTKKTFELKFCRNETSEVNYTMKITEDDARKIEKMSDEEINEWMDDLDSDYQTGLYEWMRHKEYYLDEQQEPHDFELRWTVEKVETTG